MKGTFFLSTALFLLLSVHTLSSQELKTNSAVTGVCYAGNKVNRIYIPPPEKFLSRKGTEEGGTITVYYSGFTTQAKTAFKYAVSILETLLPPDTRMTVQANWEKIESTGVLGHSSITAFAAGWAIDGFKPDAWYPVALAEKMSGERLNEDIQGDFIITLNSSVNWYLGTDGHVPEGTSKYDLVTVILHELCHGLGFFDSMTTDSGIGSYGFGSYPVIYDLFVENKNKDKLIDTLVFNNYSAELYDELTGRDLFFSGPVFRQATGEVRAELFAPSVWDEGSSIAHLDEGVTLKPNTLMTPYIDFEEAIHDPGLYTMSILGDIGWINTRFIHTPFKDTEDNITEIAISARIESDTLFNQDKVGLVFSFDRFETSDTIFMTSLNSRNTFNALVSIPSYNSDLQYYFFTEDCFLRIFNSPSMWDLYPYKTYVGADTVKPLVTHTPAAYYFETVDTINLRAEATDNIGIDSVYLEYRVNERQPMFVGLESGSEDSYKLALNIKSEDLNGGDSLRYRIFATDVAGIPNTSVDPVEGYYSIIIEEIGDVIASYSTDFTDAEKDFFKSGFEIKRPDGFGNYGLHTKHPYESPEEDNKSINYIAMLRNPLKFNEHGLLFDYRDIALVEPGETGSVFGSDDFFDYVVLEVSKDFGKSWFSLFDGYDARFNSVWLEAYNDAIVGQNSTARGKESMFLRHSEFFAPADVIQEGDTIMVRFRFYSDPYAYGWGWAIEDLKISPLIDGVENDGFRPLTLYPNPGRGIVRLTDNNGTFSEGRQIFYKVFNTSGVCISEGSTSGGSETVIDLTGAPTGMYIIILYLDDGLRSFKYSLIK